MKIKLFEVIIIFTWAQRVIAFEGSTYTLSGIGSHLGVSVISFEYESARDCRRIGA